MDKESMRKLASREGIDHQSKPVPMASRIKLDLVVVGSVAVDKSGHRIGKGEGFADLELLSDIIKENYSYWELECQKEENSNAEEVTSSSTTMDKKSNDEKKEATPSNENNTLTTNTEGSSTSLSRKENEENGRSE